MKVPKYRKINTYLLSQYKAQDTRISHCGLLAKETQLSSYIPTTIGTFYSFRFTNHLQNI